MSDEGRLQAVVIKHDALILAASGDAGALAVAKAARASDLEAADVDNRRRFVEKAMTRLEGCISKENIAAVTAAYGEIFDLRKVILCKESTEDLKAAKKQKLELLQTQISELKIKKLKIQISVAIMEVEALLNLSRF